jgi:hypothetical protein
VKFKEERPFPTPEAAERKLLELVNAVEPITPVACRSRHQHAISECWRQLRGIWRSG